MWSRTNSCSILTRRFASSRLIAKSGNTSGTAGVESLSKYVVLVSFVIVQTPFGIVADAWSRGHDPYFTESSETIIMIPHHESNCKYSQVAREAFWQPLTPESEAR